MPGVPSRRAPYTACLGGRSAEPRLAQNGQFWGVVELPAGGGRRVRGGAGCAATPVLLPPAGRRAVAARAGPYPGGGRGRAGPGRFFGGALWGGWGKGRCAVRWALS